MLRVSWGSVADTRVRVEASDVRGPSLMKSITVRRGEDWIDVDIPDSALVFRLADSQHEPPAIDNRAATIDALDRPLESDPIEHLVGEGSTVAIAFPDRVKGGDHDTAHRKVALPEILRRLERAGVRRNDIRLICAMGLHSKNTPDQMRSYLPDTVVAEFGDSIVNHDAEDPDGVVHLGFTASGDQVDFNRTCAEADLVIVLGHVQGNPYGGFSGGYKTFTTGLTSWRSIAGHHVPSTMHRDDFVPISTTSRFRHQLSEIGDVINDHLSRPIFVCDAIVGAGSRVLGVSAGDVRAVEAATWPLAQLRTDVTLDEEPADVLVFGLPRDFHYGPGMGTNPILMSQAIAAVITRAAGAFRRGGVAIVSALCDGWFNDAWFPSYQATFERWLDRGSVEALLHDVEEFATNPEWVEAYRDRYAYHPFHAFSMLSMAAIGHRYASQIILLDPARPDLAEACGYATAGSMAEALRIARRTVGDRPRLLALPDFLEGVPPHLNTSR